MFFLHPINRWGLELKSNTDTDKDNDIENDTDTDTDNDIENDSTKMLQKYFF